jgi:hypothetical protein
MDSEEVRCPTAGSVKQKQTRVTGRGVRAAQDPLQAWPLPCWNQEKPSSSVVRLISSSLLYSANLYGALIMCRCLFYALGKIAEVRQTACLTLKRR